MILRTHGIYHEAAHAALAEAFSYEVHTVYVDDDGLGYTGFRRPAWDADSSAGVWRRLLITLAGTLCEGNVACVEDVIAAFEVLWQGGEFIDGPSDDTEEIALALFKEHGNDWDTAMDELGDAAEETKRLLVELEDNVERWVCRIRDVPVGANAVT